MYSFSSFFLQFPLVCHHIIKVLGLGGERRIIKNRERVTRSSISRCFRMQCMMCAKKFISDTFHFSREWES